MRCAVRFKPNCNTSVVFIDFRQFALLSWYDSNLRIDYEGSNLRYQVENATAPCLFYLSNSAILWSYKLRLLQLPPSPAKNPFWRLSDRKIMNVTFYYVF